MQNFTRKLITEWRKLNLPFADATCIVAVSGGADSVSLLLALHELRRLEKLNLRFVAAHFNHNLRAAESERDELFVQDLANRFDFELVLGNGDFSGEKGNLEQNARRARYRFLAEAAENLDADAVLTAHTMNDQAETFLFNLLRGSGIEGLSGMNAIRKLEFPMSNEAEKNSESKDERLKIEERRSKILLVRPLLNWARREDTENFCRLNEVEFRYDAMNEDLKFNRVRIRKVLLPLLKDFNPKIIETLARTAGLLRESAKQISESSQQLAAANQPSEENRAAKNENAKNVLRLSDLRDAFPFMRQTLVREWLKNNRGNLLGLQKKHFGAIENLIFSRKSGRTIELPNGEKIIKKDGKLIFQKTKVEKS